MVERIAMGKKTTKEPKEPADQIGRRTTWKHSKHMDQRSWPVSSGDQTRYHQEKTVQNTRTRNPTSART